MTIATAPAPAAILTAIAAAVGADVVVADAGDGYATVTGTATSRSAYQRLVDIAGAIGIRMDPDMVHSWTILDEDIDEDAWQIAGSTRLAWTPAPWLPVAERATSAAVHPEGYEIGYADGTSRLVAVDGRPIRAL